MSKELSDKEFIAQCDSILGMIDDQGLDHYITCHDSPDRYEYTDPSLFKMWHDYMSLHDKIHNHLATAGDCRRLPAEEDRSKAHHERR